MTVQKDETGNLIAARHGAGKVVTIAAKETHAAWARFAAPPATTTKSQSSFQGRNRSRTSRSAPGRTVCACLPLCGREGDAESATNPARTLRLRDRSADAGRKPAAKDQPNDQSDRAVEDRHRRGRRGDSREIKHRRQIRGQEGLLRRIRVPADDIAGLLSERHIRRVPHGADHDALHPRAGHARLRSRRTLDNRNPRVDGFQHADFRNLSDRVGTDDETRDGKRVNFTRKPSGDTDPPFSLARSSCKEELERLVAEIEGLWRARLDMDAADDVEKAFDEAQGHWVPTKCEISSRTTSSGSFPLGSKSFQARSIRISEDMSPTGSPSRPIWPGVEGLGAAEYG